MTKKSTIRPSVHVQAVVSSADNFYISIGGVQTVSPQVVMRFEDGFRVDSRLKSP